MFECQTVAASAFADETGGAKAIRVLMGDFNVTPASARYQSLLADGWVDSHVAAGNPECDLATAIGCTAGRDDKTIESLKDPTVRQVERIDRFIEQQGCLRSVPGPRPAHRRSDRSSASTSSS